MPPKLLSDVDPDEVQICLAPPPSDDLEYLRMVLPPRACSAPVPGEWNPLSPSPSPPHCSVVVMPPEWEIPDKPPSFLDLIKKPGFQYPPEPATPPPLSQESDSDEEGYLDHDEWPNDAGPDLRSLKQEDRIDRNFFPFF